jgi:hypothetical protein
MLLRFDGWKDADTSQPAQVTTEEDSDVDDDDEQLKRQGKGPKKVKPTNKSSGKTIKFKERTDSMLIKVERWMNGEGVLDGVAVSEAQSE